MCPKRITLSRCSPVLPDQGWRNRLPGLTIPQHRRLTLVGNANRNNLIGLALDFLADHLLRDGQLSGPDFSGIMLNPTGLWKILGKIALGYRCYVARPVKKDGTRTGRTLIKSQYVVHGTQA